MKHILALTIAFMAGIALLFVADENRGQLQQPSSSWMSESKTIYGNSESRLAGSLSPLAVAANFYPNKAELSNDQDHDGKYDAMADHLAMLALGLLAAL